MSLKNDHDPPRSFYLKHLSNKFVCSFQVILVNFSEVAVGVSPGSKSGIGFYAGIEVGVCDQVPVPTVSQDFQVLPK